MGGDIGGGWVVILVGWAVILERWVVIWIGWVILDRDGW